MGLRSIVLIFAVVYCVVVAGGNIKSVVDFANNNWMCADISCSQYVQVPYKHKN